MYEFWHPSAHTQVWIPKLDRHIKFYGNAYATGDPKVGQAMVALVESGKTKMLVKRQPKPELELVGAAPEKSQEKTQKRTRGKGKQSDDVAGD